MSTVRVAGPLAYVGVPTFDGRSLDEPADQLMGKAKAIPILGRTVETVGRSLVGFLDSLELVGHTLWGAGSIRRDAFFRPQMAASIAVMPGMEDAWTFRGWSVLEVVIWPEDNVSPWRDRPVCLEAE